MNKDDIDKIETLIGYLEYFTNIVTPGIVPNELPAVIIEAKEWMNDIKETLS